MAGATRGRDTTARPASSAAGAWAVGDAASVRGYELAGFHGVVAETAEAVRAALEAARERGVRLIVLTEDAAARAPDGLERARDEVRLLVAVVPSLAGAGLTPVPGERIRRVVRRALGVPGIGER
jgi:vacuolar-type H+-ATPase subunit F/Vma7